MPEFLGNRPIQLLFHQNLLKGTLGHAYIFSGPEGIGKKHLALQLARSLNCSTRPEGLTACGQCTSCRKIESGTHPDVRVIEPETKVFKVDQIREMIQDIYYQPFEGRKRVFILEQADKMNEEAGNSLLKTFEEPPEKSILILITTNLYALLPTIRSRGQTLKFLPIPVRVVADYLEREKGYNHDQASRTARLSQGSIGTALNLDLEECDRMERAALQLLELLNSQDDATLLNHLGEIFSSGSDFDLFVKILISILRDLVIMEYFRDREHIAHYAYLDTLIELRRVFRLPVIDRMLHDIEEIYRKRHLNLRLEPLFQNLILTHRARLLEGLE